MTFWDRVSKQLSHPSGFGGRVVARLMNRGNASMNDAAIEQLEPAAGDRILDVGFGGGVSFRPLMERGAKVAGIDRAEDVVSAARGAHREALAAGGLELAVGEVQQLPFPDGAFDGVLTVNTIYFWPDLGAGLSELRRVLAPGGRVVVAIRDGAVMKHVSRDIFELRAPEEVRAAIEAAGFSDARLSSPPGASYHLLTGVRP